MTQHQIIALDRAAEQWRETHLKWDDLSGNVLLPTSPTVADAVANKAYVDAQVAASAPASATRAARSLLMNGDMGVAQRGTSLTGITSAVGAYLLDRWRLSVTAAGTWAMYQHNVGPSGKSVRSIRFSCTAGAEAAATTLVALQQRIEANDLGRIGFGTPGAQQLTLSFWVFSHVGGTFVAELHTAPGPRTVAVTFTVAAPSTWEFKTVTFPADPAGVAIPADASAGLYLTFFLAAGSNYTSSPLQTAWGAFDQAKRAQGQSNLLLAGAGASFYLALVQLETGSAATPFEHRSSAEELAACQRYYWRGGAAGNAQGMRWSGVASGAYLAAAMPLITMRAVPTAAIVTAPTYDNCANHSLVASVDGLQHRVTPSAIGGFRAYGGVYEADAEL